MRTQLIAPRLEGLALLLLVVVPPVPSASAQPPEAADSAAAQGQEAEEGQAPRFAESIIVTAQKREQDVVDVPISLGLVDGHTLELELRNEFSELQYLLSGLSYTSSTTVAGEGNRLRGIGTQSFSQGLEGSVGIVVDGVVLGRQGMGLLDLSDVERIEVLRGPQGTLFGKNASAGVINVVTRSPDERFRLTLGGSYATENELKLHGAIGGSLGQHLTSRLSAYSNSRDGLIEDLGQPREYNDRGEQGLRGKLRFATAANVDVHTAFDYQERDDHCCMWTTRSVSPTGFIGLFQPPVVAGPENRQVNLNGDTFDQQDVGGALISVDAVLGGVSLTSITAARRWNHLSNFDTDQVPVDFFDVLRADGSQRQVTQEVRLASSAGARLEWIAGLFFLDQRIESTIQGAAQLGLALPPGLQFAFNTDSTTDTTNTALFADMTYSLSDSLALFGGLRVQSEKSDFSFSRRDVPGQLPFPGFPQIDLLADVDDEAFSWRIGLRRSFGDRSNGYLSVARGYKAGGFNDLFSLTSLQIVEPEIPTSYEIGFKTRTAGGRLSLNAAAFSTEFDDFQAEALNTDLVANVFEVINAGRLKTEGIEVDMVFQPTPRVSLGANGAFIDAIFDRFPGAPCWVGQSQAQGCDPVSQSQVLDGAPLPNSPDLTANLSVQSTFRLGDLPFDGLVRGSFHWRDEIVFALDQDPNTRQGSVGLVNLSLGLLEKRGRYQVSFFVKNLFDEHFVSLIDDLPFDPGGYFQFPTLDADRVVGISLRVDR